MYVWLQLFFNVNSKKKWTGKGRKMKDLFLCIFHFKVLHWIPWLLFHLFETCKMSNQTAIKLEILRIMEKLEKLFLKNANFVCIQWTNEIENFRQKKKYIGKLHEELNRNVFSYTNGEIMNKREKRAMTGNCENFYFVKAKPILCAV